MREKISKNTLNIDANHTFIEKGNVR